jgi:AraC family transcriptional regulator of adaptative response/methylated-DNA-[protein]-cysteine methyltransferase
MTELTREEMFRIMRRRDADFNGRFYVGVHSTGIYCLPSCKARSPKPENVVFYRTREEAIAAGLRGCKRCRAERFPDLLPDWLHAVIGLMRQTRTRRLTERELIRLTGVDISTVRRYFRRHLGVTPLAFHRAIRLRHARGLIESGSDYLTAAFECGYESASGFRTAFQRMFGAPPGRFYAGS